MSEAKQFTDIGNSIMSENLSTIKQGNGHRQVRPRLVEGQMSRENWIFSVEVLCKAGGRREASASDAQSTGLGWRERRNDAFEGSNCDSGMRKKGRNA